MIRWKTVGIVVMVGLGTFLLYRLAEGPKTILKEVFAVGWGGVALLTSLRTDARGWMEKERRVRLNLHPLVQVALAAALLALAALATEWQQAEPLDWIYWLVALFSLPTYRAGFRWARDRLAGKIVNEKG
jgi:hypothetical protein